MSNKVQSAIEFAQAAHSGQKYGEHDYIYHLNKVYDICCEFGAISEDIRVLAYLHDVLEDTNYDMIDISHTFGKDIALKCYLLTDCNGANRKIRKKKMNALFSVIKMFPEFEDVLIVKVADRLANIREGTKNDMYKKEYEDFFNACHISNPIIYKMFNEIDNILYGI